MDKFKLFLALFLAMNCHSQSYDSVASVKRDIVPFKTALKLNLNGFKIGIEQKVYRNTTVQFEIGTVNPIGVTGSFKTEKSLMLKPQVRFYSFIKDEEEIYFGLAYLYKKQYNSYNDTITNGTDRYTKNFEVGKYIHAFTITGGIISHFKIFKTDFMFETGFGLGARFKKSTRYGLLPNEDTSLKEAYIIRPANYEETNGKFKLYPEININFSLIIPVFR